MSCIKKGRDSEARMETVVSTLGKDHVEYCLKQGLDFIKFRKSGAWLSNSLKELGAYSFLEEIAIKNLKDAAEKQYGTLLELSTYSASGKPELCGDYEKGKVFKVPQEWAQEVMKNSFKKSMKEFLDWYTWDHAEDIYNKAVKAEVLILEIE